jgi:hypothetical protein
MNMYDEFWHDSELPPELCRDMDCPDHHPGCYWDTGAGCDEPGINWLGGRPWCPRHTVELEQQIAALSRRVVA